MDPRKEVFIGQPSLAEGLQRVLDTASEAFGFAEGKQQASLTVADLTDHQYRLAQAIRSFAGGQTTPTVAGQPSIATLQNPAGSGKLFAVRHLTISNPSGAASFFYGTLGGAVLPAILNSSNISKNPRDTRIQNNVGAAGAAAGALVYGTTLGAPTAGNIVTLAAGSAGVFARATEFTVHPGGWFFVVCLSNAVPFNCGIEWDERVATQQELSLAPPLL